MTERARDRGDRKKEGAIVGEREEEARTEEIESERRESEWRREGQRAQREKGGTTVTMERWSEGTRTFAGHACQQGAIIQARPSRHTHTPEQ